jgi:hypothetical protein
MPTPASKALGRSVSQANDKAAQLAYDQGEWHATSEHFLAAVDALSASGIWVVGTRTVLEKVPRAFVERLGCK